MDIKVDYKDETYHLTVSEETTYGDLQEEILKKIRMQPYGIEYVRCEEGILGDQVSFHSQVTENHFIVTPRVKDDDGKIVNLDNKQIDAYLAYLKCRDDEKLARDMLMNDFYTMSRYDTGNPSGNAIGNTEGNTGPIDEVVTDNPVFGRIPLPSVPLFDYGPPPAPMPASVRLFRSLEELMNDPILARYMPRIPLPPIQEDVKVVMSDQSYADLQITKFADLTKEIGNCTICLDQYKDEDELIGLPCEHYFHTDCVEPWLKQESNKCPICREETCQGVPLDNIVDIGYEE